MIRYLIALIIAAVLGCVVFVINTQYGAANATMLNRMHIESMFDTDTGCHIRAESGRMYQAEVSCEEITARSYASIFVELRRQ